MKMRFRDAESLAHCHEGSHHQSQDLKLGLVLWQTHTYLTPRCYLHIGDTRNFIFVRIHIYEIHVSKFNSKNNKLSIIKCLLKDTGRDSMWFTHINTLTPRNTVAEKT